MRSARAPTSTPWNGSSSSSRRQGSACQRASTTFCWLPPDSSSSVSSGPRARMPRRAMACPAAPTLAAGAHDAVAEPFLEMRERDRAGDGAGERGRRHQRAHPAILGDHVHAGADRLRRAAALPALAVQQHLAAGEILEPEEAAQQPALAGTERAGDGDDLAEADVEVERRRLRDQPARPSGKARPLHRDACHAGRQGRLERAADHGADRRLEIDRPAKIRRPRVPPRSTTARSAMRCRSPSRCEM